MPDFTHQTASQEREVFKSVNLLEGTVTKKNKTIHLKTERMVYLYGKRIELTDGPALAQYEPEMAPRSSLIGRPARAHTGIQDDHAKKKKKKIVATINYTQ